MTIRPHSCQICLCASIVIVFAEVYQRRRPIERHRPAHPLLPRCANTRLRQNETPLRRLSDKTLAHIHGRAELGVNFLTINSISHVLIELNVVGKAAIRVEAHLL